MYELHRKVNPREVVVGWYATGGSISPSSSLIHNLYTGEMGNCCVHLSVDTSLNEASKMAVVAYTSTDVSLGEKHLGSRFVEVGYKLLDVVSPHVSRDSRELEGRTHGTHRRCRRRSREARTSHAKASPTADLGACHREALE